MNIGTLVQFVEKRIEKEKRLLQVIRELKFPRTKSSLEEQTKETIEKLKEDLRILKGEVDD